MPNRTQSSSKLIRVRYPLGEGPRSLTLRCDPDWEVDLEPVDVDAKRSSFEFELPLEGPFRYFKPVLREERETRWAQGENDLVLATQRRALEVFPHFERDSFCSECSLHSIDASRADARFQVRVFHPPGYAENTLKRYPVLYMQDGQNLFFPGEAFGGQHWKIQETLKLLTAMSLVREVIVVGVYPNDRMSDYTKPGYEEYARFVADDLVPWIDSNYRTLRGPENTAVMGSSLGGVVSFFLAWQHPDVFGNAACMSSTFGYRDDLLERVAREPKRSTRLYLDSGWPHDNYEVTRSMRTLLERRGWREGLDLRYLAFPEHVHDEKHWALRAHIPFQFFFGADAEVTSRSATRPRPSRRRPSPASR